jgi:hypothetical protein
MLSGDAGHGRRPRSLPRWTAWVRRAAPVEGAVPNSVPKLPNEVTLARCTILCTTVTATQVRQCHHDF